MPVKTMFAFCQLRDNWFGGKLTSRRGSKWISIRVCTSIGRSWRESLNYVKCDIVELLLVSSQSALGRRCVCSVPKGNYIYKFTVKVYGMLEHSVKRASQGNRLAACSVVCVVADSFASLRSTCCSNPNDSHSLEDK